MRSCRLVDKPTGGRVHVAISLKAGAILARSGTTPQCPTGNVTVWAFSTDFTRRARSTLHYSQGQASEVLSESEDLFYEVKLRKQL